MPDSVRVVRFNPFKPYQCAVGLFNGNIMIVNVDTQQVEGQYSATNHRILCLQWHPLMDNILATGTFDNNVYVHDIKKNTV